MPFNGVRQNFASIDHQCQSNLRAVLDLPQIIIMMSQSLSCMPELHGYHGFICYDICIHPQNTSRINKKITPSRCHDHQDKSTWYKFICWSAFRPRPYQFSQVKIFFPGGTFSINSYYHYKSRLCTHTHNIGLFVIHACNTTGMIFPEFEISNRKSSDA